MNFRDKNTRTSLGGWAVKPFQWGISSRIQALLSYGICLNFAHVLVISLLFVLSFWIMFHWLPDIVYFKSFKFILQNSQPQRICNNWFEKCSLLITQVSFLSRPGSVVGIATGYGLDGPGIESRWGEVFRTCPDRPWGPPGLLCKGYRVFPGGKKRPGRDADTSHPFSAAVMKG
jgi:hypothetical protein